MSEKILHQTSQHDNTAALAHLAALGVQFTRVAHGGKQPVARNGRPLKRWQNHPVMLADAETWLQSGGNVGMIAGSGNVVALDFDAHAQEAIAAYPDLATTATVKRDDAPNRAKYLVRVVGSLPRSRKDHGAGVEILSTGAHAVLAGTHASGAPVYIQNAGHLAEMTGDQVAAIWRHFARPADDAGDPATVAPTTGDGSALLALAKEAGIPGNRHNAGFTLCRWLRDTGHSEADARPFVLAYAGSVAAGDHPYTESEALATLAGTYSRRPSTRDQRAAQRAQRARATIDAVALATMTGEIDLPARPEKTWIGILSLMHRAGKIDQVALSLRDVSAVSGIPYQSVQRHIADVLLPGGLLSQTSKGDYTTPSEYSLGAFCQNETPIGRVGGAVGGAGAKGTDNSMGCLTLAKDTLDAYVSLQNHAITEPGARMHPQLAGDESASIASFGPSAQRIMATLAAGSAGSVAELAERARLSPRTTYRKLDSLRTIGVVLGDDAGTLRLADTWRAVIDRVAPALVTWGRAQIRAVLAATQRATLHNRMLRHLHGEKQTIAALTDSHAREVLPALRQAQAAAQATRTAYGRAMGLADGAIPSISLTTGHREKRVRQPVGAHGRIVIPTQAQLRPNMPTDRERLYRFAAMPFLTAPQLAQARTLAARCNLDIQVIHCELNGGD